MGRAIQKVKDMTGVYGLGFNPDSAMGLALPVGFVVVVGGAAWLFNKLFL